MLLTNDIYVFKSSHFYILNGQCDGKMFISPIFANPLFPVVEAIIIIKDSIMKIAIIHNNANTGASVHALMLAKKLQEKMDVVFLVEEIREKGMDFSEIREVHTFSYTLEQCRRMNPRWPLHVSLVVRLRMFLHAIGLLRLVDRWSFLWNLFREMEKRWYQERMPLPDDLVAYLRKQDATFDAYILMGNYNSIPFHLMDKYARKSILIPLVHQEKAQFILSAHDISRRYRFLAYNTEAEKELCERIHGILPGYNDVIGSGIEPVFPDETRWTSFREEKKIPHSFLLYVGRMTPRKTGDLFHYFLKYKEEHPSDRSPLVVVGENSLKERIEHKDILYLGFLEDVLKCDLVRHAAVVINPSRVESLSLIVLEAMEAGVPVLVNGKCEVLKRHCEASGGGFYYDDYSSFQYGLTRLLQEPDLRREMGEKGKNYEMKNYAWDVIVSKMLAAIRRVSA